MTKQNHATPLAANTIVGRNWQKLVAAAIWVALVGGVVTYIQVNHLTIGETLRQLIGLMQTPLGPLLYVLIYALRPLTFFSATLLTLAAGAIFGPIWGIIYTVIASNISATVAYGMGRILGKGIVDNAKSTGIVSSYAERMRTNSFETTLIMRFLFLPYDLVSYLAGFLHISYRDFMLATIIGSLPGTVSFVFAGASVQVSDIVTTSFRPQFHPWSLAISVVLFVVSVAFSRYLKRREHRHDEATTR